MGSPWSEHDAQPASVSRATLELFSSMRFAIALLVVLAIASIIGTVLTQDAPYPNYVDQFGPFWADIFRGLGLYTVYSTWWFMLILIFLVVSVSLCVIRNGPKMVGEARSWKDRVREDSLRAFAHKAEFVVHGPQARAQAAQALGALTTRAGYRHVVRDGQDSTLIAAKRGALTRFGYISAHLAIVVICLGGLLDSNLPITFESWLLHKQPINSNALIADIGPEHRLGTGTPSFRGNAWVPEGGNVSTAILSRPDGVLIQDLPFSIRLDKFIVEYYSTGMPRLFASNIVVTDRATGKSTAARVEVNKPFVYDGIAIYQSSFQDGGSRLHLTAWPMSGVGATGTTLDGTVNGAAIPLPGAPGTQIELVDFRAINVENLQHNDGATDVRSVAHGARSSLSAMLDARLGSGAKTEHPQDLHNVGPSVRYKLRGADGQAREFDNYMLPVDLDGSRVFLAGVRGSEAEPFRYLRIPADQNDSLTEWMRIRAALQDPAVRAEAARRFAAQAMESGRTDAGLQTRLQDSARRALDLFAGAAPGGAADGGVSGVANGGFRAVASFLDRAVPGGDQQKAAGLFLRMLEGTLWEVWQIARARAHEAPATQSATSVRFIEDTLNSLSDSFMYGAPVYLQLDSFQQVQASVFQLTRAPGRDLVYLGSLMLVAGIFSMFYVRERRLWFWLRETSEGTRVVMAMSSARRTFDFERDFERMRAAAGATLGAAPEAVDETSIAADESNVSESSDASQG